MASYPENSAVRRRLHHGSTSIRPTIDGAGGQRGKRVGQVAIDALDHFRGFRRRLVRIAGQIESRGLQVPQRREQHRELEHIPEIPFQPCMKDQDSHAVSVIIPAASAYRWAARPLRPKRRGPGRPARRRGTRGRRASPSRDVHREHPTDERGDPFGDAEIPRSDVDHPDRTGQRVDQAAGKKSPAPRDSDCISSP